MKPKVCLYVRLSNTTAPEKDGFYIWFEIVMVNENCLAVFRPYGSSSLDHAFLDFSFQTSKQHVFVDFTQFNTVKKKD